MAGPVTLGRSDAILARDVIRATLEMQKDIATTNSFDEETLINLLEFIEVQLNSIAQEELISPMRHIWKPM